MDFEKLKRAAKETLRIMNARDEVGTEENDISTSEDAPAAEEVDELLGNTQRIDFKTILERFRTKRDEPEEDEPQPDSVSIPIEGMDELAKTVDEIDKRTEEITIAADENNEKMTASLVTLKSDFETSFENLKQELADIRSLIEKQSDKSNDSQYSIITKLNVAEKKTEKLVNSLSGVSKLNDSIFDLKNSQMNTKNTVGDLEAAFYTLKRKMTTGIILISIISAVIAVLEIINLLS